MKSMTKMTRFNKVMSLVLAVLMLAGLLVPFTVSAAIEDDGVENEYSLKIVDANGQAVNGALVSVTAEGVTETDVLTNENGVAVFKAVGSDELNVVINNIRKDGDNELIAASFNVTLKKDEIVVFAFEAEAPAEPTVSYSTDWTKEDVVLTATSTSEDVAYYKWSDGTKSNTLTVTENGTYTVVAVDGFKNESAPASVTVTNIDKTAPVVSVTSAPDSRYHQSITVTVTATDENGSGVAFYKKDGNEWVAASQENANIFTVTDNGKHIFSVKDAAGNEQSVEFDVDVIDTEKPTISTIVPADDKWHNDFVEYTVTATDDKTDMLLTYGVGESFETVIWGTRGDNTIAVDERKAYTFWVKDSAGNISDPFTLAELPKIDKVAPNKANITLTPSTTEWTNQPVSVTVSATDDEGGSGIAGYCVDPTGEQSMWSWKPLDEKVSFTDIYGHAFYVIDNAGNISVNDSLVVYPKWFNAFNYDAEAPKVEVEVNPSDFTKNTIEFIVTSDDPEVKDKISASGKPENWSLKSENKGVQGQTYYCMLESGSATPKAEDVGIWSPADNYNFEVKNSKTYDFYAMDAAGNISEAVSVSGKFDNVAPVLENVKFEQKNDGKIAETLNFLTFGKFFNKTATATITAADPEDTEDFMFSASGIKSYTLVFFDEKGVKVDEHTQTVGVDEKANVFVLDYDFAVNFKGTVKVTIADALDNTLENEALTTQNSNIADAYGTGFMIENDDPVIEVEEKTILSNISGFNTLKVDVTDIVEGKKYSGINTIQIYANGVEDAILNNEYITEKTDKVALELIVDTVNKTVNGVSLGDKWSDEKIEFTFKVCDNAGNQPDAITRTVYLDQTAPEIVGFDFKSDNGVTENPATLDEYGYYFVNDATVTITAQDVLGTNENADNGVSGVDTITYAAVDVDGTIKYSGTEKTVDNKISFVIKAADGFKGTIYAYATDKVGNAPAVNAENYEGYTHPASSIFETQENHNLRDEEEDYIVFESKTEVVANQTFYSKDVELNVVVKDPYNGIQKVEWSVVGSADDAENNYSGSFTVDNKLEDGNAKITYADPAAKETDWVISSTDSPLDPIDKNLVVEMSNTMVVTNDYDGIVVTVTITDRAGNVSSETYTLSIDKTIPVVESIAPYAIVDKTAGWTNGESIAYIVTASDYWTGIAKYGYRHSDDSEIIWNEPVTDESLNNIFYITDTKLYSFFVMDNAGHISMAYKMDEHPRIDRKDVEITDILLSNSGWTDGPITFTVIANDPIIDCGCKFDCNSEEDKTQTGLASGIAAYQKDDEGWIYVKDNPNANVFEISDAKEHTIYVMDYAGNVSEKKMTALNYDNKIPGLIDGKHAVEFKTENNPLKTLINFLSFGTFFNKKVEVTVNAIDKSDETNVASGIKQVDIIFKNVDENIDDLIYTLEYEVAEDISKIVTVANTYKIKDETSVTEKGVFEIPATDLENFKGTIWVKIYDHAGNETDLIQVKTDNSEIKSTEFMIENDATKINNVAPADKTIHKDDFALTFDVSDITDKHYAGINAVQVVVNNTVVMLDDLSAGVEGVAVNAKDYSFAIDTKDKTIVNPVTDSIVPLSTDWNSGTLNVVITVVDNAGNVSTDEKTFYIDKNSPVIDGFEFSLDENIADNVGVNGELYKSINIDPIYGFYFKDAVTVTVTASDSIYTVENDATNSESIASGVATITYAYDGFDFAGNVVSKTETIAVDENNQITFTVPTGFKGQIYAYATDVVGNHPNDEEATFTDAQNSITKADAEADARFANYIGWSRPNGQVIETQTQHDGELEHIVLSVPESKYTQNNNIPLYNKDVPVTITVKDTYSGIAKVEWTVEGEHDAANNKSGVVNIDNALNLDDASWTVLKTEDNLVTEIQNTIVVNNNCNDIKINVKVTDRAGNVSETTVDGTYKTLVFGIDKTIPTIDITYDNNTPDAQYTDIYNKDRTATVVITERNFRAKDVVFKITSTDGTIPSIDLTKEASWKTVAGETPDKTTHVAVFTYNADGDYTFDISYKDNAENAAPAVAQHKFTIDKTLPVISSVVYDNNDVRDGNYYKADRVATITIVEHNFDPARIVNLGVATDDAAPVVFPAISAWTTVGDTHTATIHYSADALYTFDIDFKDMAGNNIEDYVPHAFYVDKTRPTLVIDGVAANSANKSEGNIGFTITAADTNMDVFAPVVKAMVLDLETGMFVEKTINIGTAITGHNTASYVVTNLIDDGVYSITCSVVDKAGNSFDVVVLEDENGATFTERVSDDKPLILFSVNRNGSTFYVDDPYTKELALEGGSYYTQKVENDLLIKEFNPDSIQLNDVTITVNGQKLEEGTDYERTASQNGGYTYLYTIYKTNFEAEGEYNIVIGTKDRATNEAYSDMKFGAIKFVVDKTAPVVTVTGLKTNGRYQVEEQTVTLAPTDDGGLITKLRVILTDKEGNEIEELLMLEGEELADALAKGSVSFNIPAKNSAQYVKVICEDKAGNKIGADGLGEVFSNVTITTNAFLIFWANPVARYSAIAAVVVLAAAIIFFVILKNKKKNGEADK